MAAGDAFLCVTGAAKIKVYDRDGKERGESVLGDPYIRDTKNTKGHQSPCTSGHWHPTDRRALPAWLQRARTVAACAPGIAGALAWYACLHGCRGRAPSQLLASDCRGIGLVMCLLLRSGACAVLLDTDYVMVRSRHAAMDCLRAVHPDLF